jgi:hypothetical protein
LDDFKKLIDKELTSVQEIYPGYSAEIKGSGKEQIIYVYKPDPAKKNARLLVGKVTVVFDYTYLLKETDKDIVKNPIYQDITDKDKKEYVMDAIEQFIPRQGYRFVSRDQKKDAQQAKKRKSTLKPGGEKGSGTNELEHAMGETPSYYQSTTDVGDRDILTGSNVSFNNNGRVELDYSQIEREKLKALYTREGMEKYLMPYLTNDKITTSGELQAFIDVVRTREILVEGDIPNKAIEDYISKDKFDEEFWDKQKNQTKRREEKEQLKKQTTAEKEKAPNQKTQWLDQISQKGKGKDRGVDAKTVIEKIHAIWEKK